MPRFILLEHTDAPDDPAGRHYDLLLEDGSACRTWRLAALPRPGGPPVDAVELPAHRLSWLDHEAGAVSEGRGFARRVDGGAFERTAPPARAGEPAAVVDVTLRGTRGPARLMLSVVADRWLVRGLD